MKINYFLDPGTLHETFVFLAQNQGLSGLDPPKLENPKKSINFTKITGISSFCAEFLKFGQNYANITFWRILVGPWPPHAQNLVIPVGILMFLSSPGGLETLQNTKMVNFPEKCENSAKIMKFQEIS